MTMPSELRSMVAIAVSLLAGCIDGVPKATSAESSRSPHLDSSATVALEASRELDDFHAAAAAADEARYFSHFAPHGVFLGTDATERWDVRAFRAYAHAHFVAGRGWTYLPGRRALDSSRSGDVVWFDEDLQNAHLGLARGTGVLVRDNGRLLIAQYNLTVPVPNDRMDAVVQLLRERKADAASPANLEALYNQAYESATVAAAYEPLAEAARALKGAMPAAKAHPEVDTEFWLHNELTWVRWEQGDLPRALEEVDAAFVTLDHGTLPDARRKTLRLHALWDRAYLKLEVAMQAPTPERASLLEQANGAKAAYDSQALASHDNDGMSVLESFFFLLAGKAKEAAAAARRVDVEKDEDLQDLYVIARAFDANGERAAAEAVLGRICAGHVYLMKSLLVARLAHEGHACPLGT